jgi:hypothetical protein
VRESPWGQLAASLITLAALAVLAWWEMPPAQRQLAALTARTRTQKILHRLARASGCRAMGRELAGTPESDAGYGVAYRLAVLRDRM